MAWLSKMCQMRKDDVIEMFNKMIEEEMISCVSHSEEKPEFHASDNYFYNILWVRTTSVDD